MATRRELDEQRLEAERVPVPVARGVGPGRPDHSADEGDLRDIHGADVDQGGTDVDQDGIDVDQDGIDVDRDGVDVDEDGTDVDQDLVDFAADAGGSRGVLAELALAHGLQRVDRLSGDTHGLADEGLVGEGNGRAYLAARQIPHRTRESVMDQLSELSAGCQQFLKVAAVLGKRFMLDDVSTMLNRSSAAFLSTLDEAMAAGFVVAAEHELAFESDSIWHGTVESIPAPARDALRREAMSLAWRRNPAYDQKRWVTERPIEPRGGAKEETRGLCSTAHSLIMNGHADAGVQVAERILRNADASIHARLDAEACLILGHFLLGSEEAERLSDKILRDRGTAPNDIATLMALTTKSNLLWRAGKLAAGLQLGRTAVRYSESADPVWRLHFQLPLAGKLANLREFDEAESLINDAEASLHGLPTPVWTAAPAAMRSRLFLQSGRIGDARREAEPVTAAVGRDAVPMLRPLASSVLSTVSVYMEDLPAAIEYMNQMQSDVARQVVLGSAQYAWIEILIAVKQHGPRAAVQLMSEKYSELPTQRSLYVEVPSAAAFLVLLARDIGDLELSRAVLDTVDGLARDNPGFSVVGLTAMHANALANSAPAALALIIAQSPDPISVALATEELTKLYASNAPARRRVTAPTLSEEAQARASACWAILSDMERRIAYLVGVGMTNRQIGKQIHLSAHTVNYHLRKVYKKLGINSRVELAHKAAVYSSRAVIYSMEDEPAASEHLDDEAV